MQASPTPIKNSGPAITLIAAVVLGAALYWLRDILTPLAMAIFLAMMIDGLARGLQKRFPKLPASLALIVALLLSGIALGLCLVVIANNAGHFAAQYKTYALRLEALLQSTAATLRLPHDLSLNELIKRANLTRYVGDVAQGLQDFTSKAAFVAIYLGFILASGRMWGRKAIAMFPDESEKEQSLGIFFAIRDAVESYLWIQTVTGLMIAVTSWIAMALVGLQDAMFWAFVIFLASYIPIIGGAVGILLPPLFALVQFPTIWPAVILIGVLQTINFVVGNIILPRMQGQSLNIDPVAVLLSLAFWGALWGLPGMFLSTPLTVMLMVILAQFASTRRIAILLSENGNPPKTAR